MHTCKFCNKEFETKQSLGGHVPHCLNNPNYTKNLENLNEARKFIKHYNTNVTCKFCGKQIGNNGCLVLHETRCKLNPDYLPTDKQRDAINKKLNYHRPLHLSELHKQRIREGLAKWKTEHFDEYMNYSRGKSKCCEDFKKMLSENEISFVEEYTPFLPIRLYSLDIAFPDLKIGIEINGSQHYETNGELNKKTLEKQLYFENRGWKILQIYYKDCYGAKIENFEDLLKLPIRDKKYIQSDFDERQKMKHKKELLRLEKISKKKNIELLNKEFVRELIEDSNIDFSKSGWSKLAQEFLQQKNKKWNSGVFRIIRRYFPEFLKQDSVWKRKGSVF